MNKTVFQKGTNIAIRIAFNNSEIYLGSAIVKKRRRGKILVELKDDGKYYWLFLSSNPKRAVVSSSAHNQELGNNVGDWCWQEEFVAC